MKRYIKASAKIYSAQNISSVWYRCVPKGANPESFNSWELGIHCGSKAQAEEICSTKYNGNCDIYRLALNPSVTFSNPVSDFDAWYSIEAIAEILNDGFNIPATIASVGAAYQNGEYDKISAAQYIISTTGLINPIVVYNNAVELDEQDIIILDPNSIQSIELVNAVEACNSIMSSVAELYADWSDNELIRKFYRTDDSDDEAAIQSELEYRDYVYEDGKWHKAWHSSDNRIWHF